MSDQQTQAATQEPEAIEPEIVNDSNSTALAVPETVTQLASRGSQGKAVIKAREEIIDAAIRASIRTTQPEDYVLFRDKISGRVIAYLQETGCRRIQPIWNIDVVPPAGEKHFQYEKVELGQDFAYQVIGDSYCKLTDTWIRGVEGMRCSTEQYIKQVTEPLLKDIRVRQAAKASLDGNCIRRHTGMQNIPIQFLDEVWKGSGKTTKRCAEGKGFGSRQEREGTETKSDQAPNIPAPVCEACNREMKYYPGGSKDGRTWQADWKCPDYKWDSKARASVGGHSKISAPDHERNVAAAKSAPAAESREPGQEG